jgi:hypothetical protein
MVTAIYEITNKDHLPLGVSKNNLDLGIVEFVQQAMQSVSVMGHLSLPNGASWRSSRETAAAAYPRLR